MDTHATHREEFFTVYWKIKNFSYCYKTISSPEFCFSRHLYRLDLCQNYINVECWLSNQYIYQLETEISFQTCDGSSEESVSGDKHVKLKVSKDVIFGKRRNAFLPDDTLTVRVRLRRLYVLEKGTFFISSHIGVKHKHLLWNFKYDEYNDKTAEKSTLYGEITLKLQSMTGNSDEQFSIVVCRTGGESCLCILRISVLDMDGKALNKVSDEFVFQKQDSMQTRGFPSIIKKNKWIEYKNLLLSEDKLTLKCYLALSTGTVTDQTDDTSYCENATPLLKEYGGLLSAFKGMNDAPTVSELQTDLKSMLEEGTLHDVTLHVGSEVIPAHKNILSVRSPVFRAMFSKDMKEASSNTVIIEDFNMETVQKLLLYMYTDSLHDDQWENMKSLYYAADKYGVLSLKKKCSAFLVANLSASNVCEALLLAHLHQDEELKTHTLDFIAEYDSAVFASEPWKELENNNSLFVIRVLREICCNKRFR